MCIYVFAAENTPSPQTRSPKPGDRKPSPDTFVQQEDDRRQDFIGPKLERGGATGVAEGDEGDEEDPCRSEGIVHFIIPNFSKLSEQILSDPTYIRNLPWLVVTSSRWCINCKTKCRYALQDFFKG